MQTASEMLRASVLTQAWALEGGAQGNSTGSQGPGSGRPTQKESEKQNKALLLLPKPEGTLSCNKPAFHFRPTTADRARPRAATSRCSKDPGGAPLPGQRWRKPRPEPRARNKSPIRSRPAARRCAQPNSTEQGLCRAQSAQGFGSSLRRGGSSWLRAPPPCACARAVVLVPGRCGFCSLRREKSLSLHLEFT